MTAITTTTTRSVPARFEDGLLAHATGAFTANTEQHELHVTAYQLREAAIASLRDVLCLIRLASEPSHSLAECLVIIISFQSGRQSTAPGKTLTHAVQSPSVSPLYPLCHLHHLTF
jgi:hypothetical protein